MAPVSAELLVYVYEYQPKSQHLCFSWGCQGHDHSRASVALLSATALLGPSFVALLVSRQSQLGLVTLHFLF